MNKLKKILFISNGTKSSIDTDLENLKLDGVYVPCIKALNKNEYKIFAGINNNNINYLHTKEKINYFNQMVYRSIFNIKDNFNAYKNLNNLLSKEQIDIIHCNTPIGGALGRLCGKKNNVKKIIYTVHGFHFYKGNNILKNFIFKTAERFLARYTDAIITLNSEDYAAAKNFKLKKGSKIYYLPGIGIDTKSFKIKDFDRDSYRKTLGFNEKDIVCMAIGDLNQNKNFSLCIKAIAETKMKNLHLIICGVGDLQKELEELSVKLNIKNQIHFYGFRNDIKELLNASDIFLISSYREGLSRALMEAMSAGLPCIVSNIRGNVDLIDDKLGGFLLPCNDYIIWSKKIIELSKNSKLRRKMGQENLNKIKKFDLDIVVENLKQIYDEVL